MSQAARSSAGQALVEYAFLLAMGTAVMVALWYFVSEDYHQKVFERWAKPLGRSVEITVDLPTPAER